MWLNSRFEVKVLKFVSDELLKNRHKAGDNYVVLSGAVAKIVNKSFTHIAIQNVAKAINHIVFNEHRTGIRNTEATAENLKELAELETKISDLINEGFISEYNGLIKYLRKLYNKKHQPKLFAS
jgi:hypothetical protein